MPDSLSTALFCFHGLSCLIAYYGFFAEKEGLICPPSVSGEVLLMCMLGVRCAGSHFHYLTLNTPSRQWAINDTPV